MQKTTPRKILFLFMFFGVLLTIHSAHAEFTINSAIVEFTAGGPPQQDIEIVSHSADNQYIVSEISEIIHPGASDETRQIIKEPAHSGLLVTPDKTILAGNSRKVLRFVLLKEPDAAEHIYRVAIKPVIKGVNNNATVGLKILVGYEVLVIVRPAAPAPNFTAARHGMVLTVSNTGNTNILFQAGQQCAAPTDCKPAPVARIYPGGSEKIALPANAPVIYSVWDGKNSIEKQFD